MTPVVYIDILFIVNFMIDFVLLYITSRVCKCRAGLWRLILGAAIGGLYSCAIFFPYLSPAVCILGKVLFSAALVSVFVSGFRLRRFLKAYAMFWAVSVVFGGTVFAICLLTNVGVRLGAVFSNGEFYMQLGIVELFAAIVLASGGIFLFTRLCRKNFAKDRIILPLLLSVGEKRVQVKALIDTGCELCDPVDGKPVILVWEGAVNGLFDSDVKQKLGMYNRGTEHGFLPRTDELAEYGIYMIPFSSVGAKSGMLPAVRLNGATDMSGKFNIEDGCCMAIVSFPLSDDGIYDAVLNPDILHTDNTQGGNTNVQKIFRSVSNKIVSMEVSARIAPRKKGALYRGRRGAASTVEQGGGGKSDCLACQGGEFGTGTRNAD